MNVLVAAADRLGAEVLQRLALEGDRPAVLSATRPSARVRALARWIKADRRDGQALEKALAREKLDAVIDVSPGDPAQVAALAKAVSGKVGRYVLRSETAVYRGPALRLCTEHDPLAAAGPKGRSATARARERALRGAGVPWCVVRAGATVSAAQGAAAWYAARVVDGGPVLVRAEDRRPFQLLWAADLARALALAARHPRTVNRAFNAAGEELWTTEGFVRALCGAAGRVPDLERLAPDALAAARALGCDPPGFGGGALVDTSRLRARGWAPTPADRWLALLLEAAAAGPVPDGRAREIALALRARREREAREELRAAGENSSNSDGLSPLRESA